MTLTAAIKEAYASAPQDIVVLHTLEILHPSFRNDAGQAVSVRVVLDHVDHNLKLEAGAPLNGGQTVLFTPFYFSISLPPEEKESGVPEAIIAIDNATREIVAQLERAVTTKDVITVIYRAYISNDTAAGPQNDPPLLLDLKDVQANVTRVTARAVHHDPRNRRFPALDYTAAQFPGLAR